jgi:hypothetical protein
MVNVPLISKSYPTQIVELDIINLWDTVYPLRYACMKLLCYVICFLEKCLMARHYFSRSSHERLKLHKPHLIFAYRCFPHFILFYFYLHSPSTSYSTLKPTPPNPFRIPYITPHSSPMALTTPKHSTKHILLITLGVKPFTLICCSLVVIPRPWGYAIWRAWRIPMNWQLRLNVGNHYVLTTNKYSFSYWKINLVGFCVHPALVNITRVLSVQHNKPCLGILSWIVYFCEYMVNNWFLFIKWFQLWFPTFSYKS